MGLKQLVDACHAKGLAVVLDVVYNHFGPSGNYLPRYGPYLTSRYNTAWGSAVNFDDRGSDEVRRLVCDNALSWMLDYQSTACGWTRLTRLWILRRFPYSSSSRRKPRSWRAELDATWS